MCGIAFAQDASLIEPPARRGPDEATVTTVTINDVEYTLFFNRLSVYAAAKGRQPFKLKGFDGHEVFSATNGEIYNHKHLDSRIADVFSTYADDEEVSLDLLCAGSVHRDAKIGTLAMHRVRTDYYDSQRDSDCRVIPYLIMLYGVDRAFNMVRGVFASITVISDYVVLARDLYGVRPLYWGHDAQGNLVAVSSPNCIKDAASVPDLRQFPPGKVLVWSAAERREIWLKINPTTDTPFASKAPADRVVHQFYEACRMRCAQQDDSITTVLLSGGMDSSVVLAMACHFLGPDKVCAITGHVKGSEESSDVRHARALCARIGCHAPPRSRIRPNHARIAPRHDSRDRIVGHDYGARFVCADGDPSQGSGRARSDRPRHFERRGSR